MAIIDNVTRTLASVTSYDTYERDSSQLERDLLTIRTGDIVVLFTHDEPATKLSSIARLLLHELGDYDNHAPGYLIMVVQSGSFNAQNIQYRSSWLMVTQKGIDGYSPYEKIALPVGGGWAPPQDLQTCVDFRMQGCYGCLST